MRERQARYASAHQWVNMGTLTHEQAARALARLTDMGGYIETRDAGSDVVFKHHVQRQVTFKVRSLRGDKNESE